MPIARHQHQVKPLCSAIFALQNNWLSAVYDTARLTPGVCRQVSSYILKLTHIFKLFKWNKKTFDGPNHCSRGGNVLCGSSLILNNIWKLENVFISITVQTRKQWTRNIQKSIQRLTQTSQSIIWSFLNVFLLTVFLSPDLFGLWKTLHCLGGYFWLFFISQAEMSNN